MKSQAKKQLQLAHKYEKFTLGQIAEPYYPKPYNYSFFSKDGLKERFSNFKRVVRKNYYHLFNFAMMKPSFSKKKFIQDIAKPNYFKIQEAIQKKDYSTISDLTTSFGFFSNKKILINGKLESIDKVKIYHMVNILIPEIQKNICQVTLEMEVTKNLNNEKIKEKEYVVFEKSIKQLSSPWKYVGKIDTKQPIRFPTKKDLINI